MQSEESHQSAVSSATGDQDDPVMKRARDIDIEVRRLGGEIETVGLEIRDVSKKIITTGESITQDMRAFRAQGKTEEEIQKLVAFQKRHQAVLEALQSDLKAQQAKLKTQRAKLEAERDLRFYEVTRLAAEEIKRKIEACPPQDRTSMLVSAVSGSGKTSSMFSALSRYFGIYLLCTPRASDKRKSLLKKNEFNECFAVFDDAVSQAVVVSKLHTTSFEKTQEAVRLATALVASYLVMLWVFLTQFPDANPYQFLIFELGAEGVDFVTNIFTYLKGFTTEALEDLCRSLRVPLETAIVAHNAPPHLVVALDEIEAASGALTDEIDPRNGSNPGLSLLYPVERAVRDLAGAAMYHQLYGGTGSNEARSVSLTSDIGKDSGSGKIRGMAFPVAKEEDVVAILGKVTGLAEDAIMSVEGVKAYLVNARFRLTTLAADMFRADTTGRDTVVRLGSAVNVSIDEHKRSLTDSIKKRVAGGTSDLEKTKNLSKLHRVYVAAKVTGGEMPFADPELDLCQLGVAGVDSDGVFHVTELFALETIEEFLEAEKEIGIALGVGESLNDLETLVNPTGEEENLFESLVMNSLRRFDGMKVLDLPFIRGLNPSLKPPAEWENVVFTCTAVSSSLGISSNASEFLTKNPGVFLLPEAVHRADGLLTLGSSAIVEVGCKLYSGTVSSDDVRSQFVSTSPTSAYELSTAYRIISLPVGSRGRLSDKAFDQRDAWVAAKFNERTALRIHVTLPSGAEHRDSPDHVWKPGVFLVGSDIVVNLDKTNFQWLFGAGGGGGGGGGTQPSEVRAALWRVLKGITGAKEFDA